MNFHTRERFKAYWIITKHIGFFVLISQILQLAK